MLFQYKDAFLNANPDFKWYKLPAPPLRTLNTRPTNKKSDSAQSDSSSDIIKSDYLSSDLAKLDEDSIQPGKLADESQIGGLSSLFTPQKVTAQDFQASINNPVFEDVSTDIREVPKPPKKRYCESPISTESKEDCKADLFGNKKSRTESNNNNNHHTVNYFLLKLLNKIIDIFMSTLVYLISY
jgi:hypothetical protein